MRAWLVALALATPAGAEGLPAFYSVTGVAANDVLNVRAEPDAGAAILSGLAPDAARIEVVGLSPDGDWAQVNAGDMAGWVALRFLARDPGPDWTALQTPLACYGTEPFWSLRIDPSAATATFETPIESARPMWIDRAAIVEGGPPAAGFLLRDGGGAGFATVAAGACSDGMSDRMMGLTATLFTPSGTGLSGYSGCCRLAP
ncbi:MAG: SH3 domain-containing protein [Gemmobacter sp.]